MAKVKLKYTYGDTNCEDCGYYNWERLEVWRKGVPVFAHYSDDHLDGSNSVNVEGVRQLATLLVALGHTVETVIKEAR